MKKSHAKSWLGFGVFFMAAVYSVIVFLVKPKFDISAWVLYGSTMIAFLLAGIQLVTMSGSGSGMVMDVTSLVITGIYFFIQLLFGGIIFLSREDLPLTPVVVCEIILLAAYLVISFVMNAARSSSTAQDKNDAAAVRSIRMMETDVLNLADSESNPAIKKALNGLAEEIHFATPSAGSGTADADYRISQNIAILKTELANRNGDPMRTISLIRDQLKERERAAAISR